MSTIQDAPALRKKDTSASSIDEKASFHDHDEKGGLSEKPIIDPDELKHVVLERDVGDVFEGPRAIDLDADGKERPIG